MSIYKTYSARKKAIENAGKAQLLQTNDLPQKFRKQVFLIMVEALGGYTLPDPADKYGFGALSRRENQLINSFWEKIGSTMMNELDNFQLDSTGNIPRQFVTCFMLTDTEKAIDIIEISFHVINTYARDQSSVLRPSLSADQAIAELNQRFHEHNIGFQFVAGQLIEETSEFVHKEMTEPAVNLLQQVGFSGANSEYLSAHKRYLEKDYSGAIVDANKAFESTMKTIATKKGWSYDPGATVKPLVTVMFANNLIPSNLQTHFHNLAAVLETGAANVRNSAGSAHGSGANPITIPSYLASYVLNVVASNIILLVNAFLGNS